MFGLNTPDLTGKAVRQKPKRVEEAYVDIPQDFIKLHRFKHMMEDVIFLNGLQFLLTHNWRINLLMIEFLPTHTVKTLAFYFNCVMRPYSRTGFAICIIMMVMEFEKVKDEMPAFIVNTTTDRGHG